MRRIEEEEKEKTRKRIEEDKEGRRIEEEEMEKTKREERRRGKGEK